MITQYIVALNKFICKNYPIKATAGLSDIITTMDDEEEKTYPAEYKGNRKYEDVFKLNRQQGAIYHRISGDIETTKAEDPATTYDNYVTMVFPIRSVYLIPKKTFKQTVPDVEIGLMVSDAITSFDKRPFEQDNFVSLLRDLSKIDINRKDVLSEEGNTDFEIDLDIAVGAVNWTLTAEGELSCVVQNICH